jgi:hypothetical protein
VQAREYGPVTADDTGLSDSLDRQGVSGILCVARRDLRGLRPWAGDDHA